MKIMCYEERGHQRWTLLLATFNPTTNTYIIFDTKTKIQTLGVMREEGYLLNYLEMTARVVESRGELTTRKRLP